jgi:Fibronectin type III domain
MKVQVLPTSLAVRNYARLTVVGSLTLASALVGIGTSASSATIHGQLSLGTAHHVGAIETLGARRAHALIPPLNPTSNLTPTSTMYSNCLANTPTSSQITNCDQLSVAAINAARASENVGPMTLPVGYDQMPQSEQLLVVSNLERADRGLAPIAGLSSSLDVLALKGAQNDSDPSFPNPFYGTSGGSNWASTSSVLLADFLFMYDDGPGPGGINIDCTTSNTSGCWGHRDNILANFDQPLLMGAATVSGSSLTEEFIGGDHVDKPDVTAWSSLATLFPAQVSTSAITLNAGTGAPKSSVVTVSDSGVTMNITASIDPAGSEWSLGPYSCNLQPGTSCPLTVYLAPTAGGVTSATLKITGPNGTIAVTLSASSVSPAVPGTPTNVIAHSTPSRVRVSWSAPASNGGDPITAYRVYSSPAGLHCTTSTTTCIMINVSSHKDYLFTVVAQNAIGFSPHSTPSNRVSFTK